MLGESPLRAYRFETPAWTTRGLSLPFEFVLVHAPRLDRRPDTRTFAEPLSHATTGESVTCFASLGRDAMLVVPLPLAAAECYVHLASFLRRGPDEQKQDLWQQVVRVLRSQLGVQPRWLNTAGGGVAWLHVRIDTRPKYYAHVPYKNDSPDT
jgi:hypothetical protein